MTASVGSSAQSGTNKFGIQSIDRLSGKDGICGFCGVTRLIFGVKRANGSWGYACSECSQGARTMP